MGPIIMLGTGDAGNDQRMQTCLAVPIGSGETALLDTGAGSALLGRLRHARIALATVRHVVVTHRHFDHAGGLAPLLLALIPVTDARVTVWAPPATLAVLHEVLALTMPGLEDWLGKRLYWRVLTDGEPVALGAVTLTPFEVDHGVECMGLRLEQDGAVVVFSSDTRPCLATVAHARGADVLIHEAAGLNADAATVHAYGHSTAHDAGAVAHLAGANRLVLTHLRSSRSVNHELLALEARAVFGGCTVLADDLHVVDPAQRRTLPGIA